MKEASRCRDRMLSCDRNIAISSNAVKRPRGQLAICTKQFHPPVSVHVDGRDVSHNPNWGFSGMVVTSDNHISPCKRRKFGEFHAQCYNHTSSEVVLHNDHNMSHRSVNSTDSEISKVNLHVSADNASGGATAIKTDLLYLTSARNSAVESPDAPT